MAETSLMPGQVKIKVIGLGGGGCNSITRMIREQIRGVEFIAMNTDAQHLETTEAPLRIQLGEHLTHGLGAGGDPAVGRKAAEETIDEIKQILDGADMIFITAGMGGGTGTGSAPVVAEIAKNLGALTVAVVTKPFSFEGKTRTKFAENGLRKLKEKVDSLIAISNDKLLEILDPNTTILNAFWICDDILREAVKGISDLIMLPGIINVNFADVKTIMEGSGSALMGIGRGTGESRAIEAARAAIDSPLLELSIEGAKGILFNISIKCFRYIKFIYIVNCLL